MSRHWADPDGCVHWIAPSGEVRRSRPNNFGVIGNGHFIKLGDDPEIGSPWDTNFENEFQNADNNFSNIIEWLESLGRCDPPFDRPIVSRIKAHSIDDKRFSDLIECLVSLAARSPMYRERAVALAEHHRGRLPERERNSLIGANMHRSLRNAVRSLGGAGKTLVIFSPEKEFIFGDGFYHNLTVQGEHWNHPKLLVPLTPSMSVLFARPHGYMTEPRIATMVASIDEVIELNFVIQAYSRQTIFYRSEKPTLDDVYTCGKHKVFSDDRNVVDRLIYQIPGVRPRDANMDRIIDFLDKYGK